MKKLSQAPGMRKRRIVTLCICIVLIVVIVIAIVAAVRHTGKNSGTTAASGDTKTTTKVSAVVGKPATATIMSTGDIIPHKELVDNAKTSSGAYDFNYCFDYCKSTVQAADLSVCDFEYTLTDGSNGYSFYPCFQAPYSTVDAVKNAGFDVVITANNHAGDQGGSGIAETTGVIRKKGLKTVGTKLDTSEKNYRIVDVNGIKIGMCSYTFGTIADNGQAALNGGTPLSLEASAKINVFDYNHLDDFYAAMKTNISNMKADGAEAIMLYMHWGNEYQTTESSVQDEMAQKMCDLGADVIIGGHPHVIEPAKVLTSDNGHRMMCLYSDGNLLSNQRVKYMDDKSGHTEDGVFFYTTFTRDEDGNVTLSKVSYTPTWVNYYEKNGKTWHQIIPLNDLSSPASLGLNNTANGLAQAKASKARTDALLADGVAEYNK